MSLISVEVVSKSYFHNTVLKDVNLRLNEGDRLGLIGSNGAGKTTLFKIITGSENADAGRVVVAKNRIIGYLGQNTDTVSGGASNSLKNKELQELEAAIRDTEIGLSRITDHESPAYRDLSARYTLLSARFEAMDGYSYERSMKEILTGLELSEAAFSTPVGLLSGGEKMRVALAHILLMHPDILLLDEPTNHLDITAMEWLEDTLIKFKGALIIISHDRYFLDRVCNRMAELESGTLVIQSGNYTGFMKQKEVETDFAVKEKLRLEREIDRQMDIKQTMFSHRNMSGYHMKEKMVSKLADKLSEAQSQSRRSVEGKMKFSLLPSGSIRNPKSVILRTEALSKSFGTNRIFENLSFEITAVDKVFFVGPNGCGKSTLLSILLGLAGEYEGTVSLSRYSTYAFMGQKVQFSDENIRIIDEICGRFDFSEGQARSLLAKFGFYGTDVMKQISVLSGGERSRLYLACILQENPEIIFLDEPTNHLDIPSREILEQALSGFGGALIAVSHDRYFIEKCARRIFGFISKGIMEFPSFDSYRIKERESVKAAEALSKRTDSAEMLHNPAVLRRNKADERKFIAQRRDQVRFTELEIARLEEEKERMEASFGADTLPEEYSAYSSLLTQIEKCYNEYASLLEED
ncbi:MAG: ribosomal protection-like ABC-F family protein [Saccharofermentanales bacterium]